jgi:hypothetical protein
VLPERFPSELVEYQDILDILCVEEAIESAGSHLNIDGMVSDIDGRLPRLNRGETDETCEYIGLSAIGITRMAAGSGRVLKNRASGVKLLSVGKVGRGRSNMVSGTRKTANAKATPAR